MNTIRYPLCGSICVFLLLLLFDAPAQGAGIIAYVGPGAGLSMLGALFAVACVLLLAVLAPILYPLRAFLAWRRRVRELRRLPAGKCPV